MNERMKHNDDGGQNVSAVYLITADGERVDITNRSTTSTAHHSRPSRADGSVQPDGDDVLKWKRMAVALAWNLRNSTHPSYDQTIRREILDDFEEMMLEDGE